MKHLRSNICVMNDGSARIRKRTEEVPPGCIMQEVGTLNSEYGISPVDYIVDGEEYITLEHLGSMVKKHLVANGWSQKFFADRCHVPATTVARWAQGKNFIPPEFFADLKANQKIPLTGTTKMLPGRKSWRRTLTIDSDMLTVLSNDVNFPTGPGQKKVRCVPNITDDPDDYVYHGTGYITFEHLQEITKRYIKMYDGKYVQLAKEIGTTANQIYFLNYNRAVLITEELFIRLQKLVVHAGRPRKNRKIRE